MSTESYKCSDVFERNVVAVCVDAPPIEGTADATDSNRSLRATPLDVVGAAAPDGSAVEETEGRTEGGGGEETCELVGLPLVVVVVVVVVVR